MISATSTETSPNVSASPDALWESAPDTRPAWRFRSAAVRSGWSQPGSCSGAHLRGENVAGRGLCAHWCCLLAGRVIRDAVDRRGTSSWVCPDRRAPGRCLPGDIKSYSSYMIRHTRRAALSSKNCGKPRVFSGCRSRDRAGTQRVIQRCALPPAHPPS